MHGLQEARIIKNANAADAARAQGEKNGGIRPMDFARYEQYRETGVHEVPGFA